MAKTAAKRWEIHRRLYDWTLSFSRKKHSSWALFVNALLESIFFPIPPDVLLIAMSLGNRAKSWWYALVATLGTAVGWIGGYFIGLFLYDALVKGIVISLGLQADFVAVGSNFADNAFLYVAVSAFTPIPDKLLSVAAGFWKIDLFVLVAAVIVGKGLRFFIEAALLYVYGRKIKDWIERYFNLVTFLALVLIVGGFLLIRYA